MLFVSFADGLVAGDTDGEFDLFVRDRDPDLNGILDEGNGVTRRLTQGSDQFFYGASISGDGRYVVYVEWEWPTEHGDLVVVDPETTDEVARIPGVSSELRPTLDAVGNVYYATCGAAGSGEPAPCSIFKLNLN